MLRSVWSLTNYGLAASDGELGKVKDLLFDDTSWITRYLVVDCGTWLPGRRVLIVPSALGECDWKSRELEVHLSKSQVENSPGIEEDQPVSRQREAELHRYYSWNPYWYGPTETPPMAPVRKPEELAESPGDADLRSCSTVTGYHVAASDGRVGHVDDFIVDDDTWHLRYVVVDTKNWLPGKKVLLSPGWIDDIDWAGLKIEVDLTRAQVRRSPPYDPTAAVNRRYEEQLYDFYGRPHYWP